MDDITAEISQEKQAQQGKSYSREHKQNMAGGRHCGKLVSMKFSTSQAKYVMYATLIYRSSQV